MTCLLRSSIVASVAFTLASVLGCGDGEDLGEDSDMSGPKPWDMWGTSQTFTVDHSLLTILSSGGQIVKINYGRPETWNFFFGARFLAVTDPDDAGQINVYFNLTVGTGRSSIDLPGFEHYIFSWPAAPPPAPLGEFKYSTSVIAPPRNDLTPTVLDDITEIIAQDIQCNVSVDFTGGATPVKQAQVEVTAFFAPMTHIRPEWFLRRFSGGEENGR
jgi:hypothetical protein